MKLSEKQILKLKHDISKMSDIDQSQANTLHGYLNERADRLDRTNAILVRSEIDNDN